MSTSWATHAIYKNGKFQTNITGKKFGEDLIKAERKKHPRSKFELRKIKR